MTKKNFIELDEEEIELDEDEKYIRDSIPKTESEDEEDEEGEFESYSEDDPTSFFDDEDTFIID